MDTSRDDQGLLDSEVLKYATMRNKTDANEHLYRLSWKGLPFQSSPYMMKPKVMKNDELMAASHPALISAEDVMINDGLRWILSTYYVVLSMRRGQRMIMM